MVRLFQSINMTINPSFLSQYHSFKCCLGCWHPAVSFQALSTSPGVCTAEALSLHLIICPQLYFEWAQAHVHSLCLCWRFCGRAEALGQTAPPGSWRWVKESSCSTSGGQRGVELGLLHAAISSQKSGLWTNDTMNFFNSCFKSCILKKEREKNNQTLKTCGEMQHKKESERWSGKGHREMSPSFVGEELP